MNENETGAVRGAEDIRRDAGAARSVDTTQTFGHDSDLSFTPFGSDLTDAELEAIAALPERAALLLVRSGPTAGARYLLDTDVTTIGRHPEADIFFDDVTVSRRHAEVTRTGGFFELVDQRSLNGTYVNRERVDRAVLDAVVRRFRGGPVGLSTLAVTVGEEAETIESVVEPYLVRIGFLGRTPRGRIATPEAYAHLRVPQPGEAAIFDDL